MARTRVLVAFVDGLGVGQTELLGDLAGSLPHARALSGVLGYTAGALPTVLTGYLPESHGRMCTFRHAPEGQTGILQPLRWLGLLPRAIHERSVVRRAAARWAQHRYALSGYLDLYRIPPKDFEWLDIAERANIFGREPIGGRRTFLQVAREAGLRVACADWKRNEDDRFQAVENTLRSRSADLTFLYATGLDGVMHRLGTRGPEVRQAGRRIVSHIARVRDILARDGSDVRTWVVGDHGMADVIHHVHPDRVLRGLSADRVFVDSTMIRVWAPSPTLDKLPTGTTDLPGEWLKADELQTRGSPGDGSYGNAIFVLREGYLFRPSSIGGCPRGMHGYDLSSPSSRAALMSDTEAPRGVRMLADISALVLQSLGLVTQESANANDPIRSMDS